MDMNISGVNSPSRIYDYNNIEIQGIRKTPILPKPTEESSRAQSTPQEQSVGQERLKQNYTAYDYAKGYQPDAEYELVGADSDIAKLDVTRAVSDMRKDQVLQQYQFFVGTSRMGDDVTRTSDIDTTAVRGMENFSL